MKFPIDAERDFKKIFLNAREAQKEIFYVFSSIEFTPSAPMTAEMPVLPFRAESTFLH